MPTGRRTSACAKPPMRRSALRTICSFHASCAGYARCCTWQPPHTPNTAQNGLARIGDSDSYATTSPTAYFGFTCVTRTRARSPGSGPVTNTTWPFTRPTA